jgi:mRNA-degrading endonuclease toxin of MazEF toxin-antitoxin module
MERGEIWHCDLSPSAGREQRGPHYVLIVSPRQFNRGGVPIVCPITTVGNTSRMRGFAVSLQGAGTGVTGVIQVDQLGALDMTARKGKPSGDIVPDFIMDDVLSRIATLVQ